MSAADYPLLRDAAEHERLQAQARFWSLDASALFEAAGVAPGWRAADLGCGTLDVCELLAQRVGARGSVTGVDNDRELVARSAPAAQGIAASCVRLVEGDAYATRWPAGCLDAAHARFVAAPAGRLPELLAEMRRLVRRGGVVMLQEPDADTWRIPAAGPAWTRLREFIRIGFELRGGNFDAGACLLGAMRDAGLGRSGHRKVSYTLPASHPYAALPLAFARQLRPLWLKEGVLREAEIDDMVAEVSRALQAGGDTQTFTLVQAWGRRP